MAGGGLPEGLVSNKEGVRPVEEGEFLQPRQVAWLWRVYASKRTVLADNIGRRLENFFWRIWSNERLRQRLSGAQINILFEIINEGGVLRTTPTSSPRSSKSLTAYYKQARLRSPPTTPPNTETAGGALSSTEDELLSNTEESRDSSAVPPRSFAKLERLNHPGPLSSHGEIGGGTFTAAPVSPLAASSESGRSSQRLPSCKVPEDCAVTPLPTSPLAALGNSPVISKENRRTSPSAYRRPPILKKEGSSASSRSSRSTKAADASSGEPEAGQVGEIQGSTLLEDASNAPLSSDSGSARRITATRFNEEVAVSIPKPSTSAPRPGGDRMGRLGAETGPRPWKRNPVVVASTGASKTRPTFARQKSSLSSSRDAPSRSSSSPSLARSPKLPPATATTDIGSDESIKQSTEHRSLEKSRAVSPHPSRRRRRPSPGPLSTEKLPEESRLDDPGPTVKSRSTESLSELSASEQPQPQRPLDDSDSRAKTIGKTRASQRSVTDLATFARKSSAALPTAASFQASGMMHSVEATSSADRGKGREAFTNVTAPLKGPGPSAPSRTQSQLTLLLEKQKTRSTNEERKDKRSEL